jgi:hypothetical protein
MQNHKIYFRKILRIRIQYFTLFKALVLICSVSWQSRTRVARESPTYLSRFTLITKSMPSLRTGRENVFKPSVAPQMSVFLLLGIV